MNDLDSSLVDAIRGGRFDEAKRLLCRGGSPSLALPTAIEARNTAFLRRLLESGADPNAVDDFGDTPAMIASRGDFPVELKLLLSYGANPNFDNGGWTPLRCAAKDRNVPMVTILLQAGARIPATDSDEFEWAESLDEFVTECTRTVPLFE